MQHTRHTNPITLESRLVPAVTPLCFLLNAQPRLSRHPLVVTKATRTTMFIAAAPVAPIPAPAAAPSVARAAVATVATVPAVSPAVVFVTATPVAAIATAAMAAVAAVAVVAAAVVAAGLAVAATMAVVCAAASHESVIVSQRKNKNKNNASSYGWMKETSVLTSRPHWGTITVNSLDPRVAAAAAAVVALRDRQVAELDQGVAVRDRHGEGAGVDGQE